MIENPLFEFIAVIGVFIGIIFCTLAILVFIRKMRLYNIVGVFASSIGISLVFSIGSFVLIELSQKFAYWTVDAKLKYSGEIFLFLFIVLFFLIYEIFNRRKPNNL